MKKTTIFLFVVATFSFITSTSQTRALDSLNSLLSSTKNDTSKVDLLWKISFQIVSSPRQAMVVAMKGLELARKINYKKGEANCLNILGGVNTLLDNYPRGLYYYLEALKIREKLNDSSLICGSYGNISYIYFKQGDYPTALEYCRKAQRMKKDLYHTAVLDAQFAELFEMENQPDSALIYTQRSYELYTSSSEKYQLDDVLRIMGNLHAKMGDNELALGYYHQALRNGYLFKDSNGLSDIYLKLAELLKKTGSRDSAIFYALQSLNYAHLNNLWDIQNKAARLLSDLYAGYEDTNSRRYMQVALVAEDSLYNQQKNIQIENMSFDEKLRQNELAARKEEEEARRKLNIQYAMLGIGIITFIFLFFILNRSIIINEKWISFLGVLGLLTVFEFINLVIHPVLASITNDSPLPMLFILVSIAAILIPMHHRLEKWVKEKMTEKHRRIRLEAARKTIEKLENKNP